MKDKKEIKVQIFHDIDYKNPIPFSRIKDIVQDNDIIEAGWDQGFYSENNSIDPHYYLAITRKRLETDDECQKRLEEEAMEKYMMEQRRYNSYLKLKEEFKDYKPDEGLNSTK